MRRIDSTLHNRAPLTAAWQRWVANWAFALFAAGISSPTQLPPAASTVHNAGGSAATRNRVLNGRWWTAILPGERSGYVNGYEDCYVYDVNGPRTATGWTANDYVRAVDSHYRQHEKNRTTPVSTVLKQINRTGKSRPVPKGGEEWKEPHGYYDGLWWRESSQAEQLGYVEGYLSCYSNEVASPVARFSKTATEYVALVNSYINAHPQSDDEKLANILRRFHDRPSER